MAGSFEKNVSRFSIPGHPKQISPLTGKPFGHNPFEKKQNKTKSEKNNSDKDVIENVEDDAKLKNEDEKMVSEELENIRQEIEKSNLEK